MFFLLELIAETALAALAIAAGTMLVIGLLVAGAVWLADTRPGSTARRG